jgi:hypothetical protein
MINRRRFIQLGHAATVVAWLRTSEPAAAYWEQCGDCWCEYDDDDDSLIGYWCPPEQNPDPLPAQPAPPPPDYDDGTSGNDGNPWLGGVGGGDPINVATGGSGGDGTLVFQANSDWGPSNAIGISFSGSGSYITSTFGFPDGPVSIGGASSAATSDSGQAAGVPTTTGSAGGDLYNRIADDVFTDMTFPGPVDMEFQGVIGNRGGEFQIGRDQNGLSFYVTLPVAEVPVEIGFIPAEAGAYVTTGYGSKPSLAYGLYLGYIEANTDIYLQYEATNPDLNFQFGMHMGASDYSLSVDVSKTLANFYEWFGSSIRNIERNLFDYTNIMSNL